MEIPVKNTTTSAGQGRPAVIIRTSDELWLRTRSVNRGLFNFPTLRHRRFDAMVATMHQSGTHWLKYMLGLTLAKLYNVPPPASIKDNSIIGRNKAASDHPNYPRIGMTHSIPHYFLRSRVFVQALHFPRYLILARDIRDALVAHYEKRKTDYDVDFSTYLRGDVRGKKYRDDIWLRIRFMNGWGAVIERHPERAAVLTYEDLVADTRGQLARVLDHFNIEGITPQLLDDVVAASSKAEMARLKTPNAKWVVVRMDTRPSTEWYSDEDRQFVAEVCRRNLKYSFGYQYW